MPAITLPVVSPPAAAVPESASAVPPAMDANSAALLPIPTAEPALDAAEATVVPTAVAASPAAARADMIRGSIPLMARASRVIVTRALFH